jgi:NAD(P)H-hydrate epimerase
MAAPAIILYLGIWILDFGTDATIRSCRPLLSGCPLSAKASVMRPLSRAEIREVDRRAIEDYGMSGLVLMENAGRGCVDTLLEIGCRGPVAVVCGKGNNAGDGFVIARHLELRGVPTKVILLFSPDELRGAAAANYAILIRSQTKVVDLSANFNLAAIQSELAGAEWIVDALLGTGSVGAPRYPLDAAIRAMNNAPARRLAVDLPSGLDCDTGEPAEPTIRADHTCTFVAPKLGFNAAQAAPYLGRVHILEIGVPRRLVEEIAASDAR